MEFPNQGPHWSGRSRARYGRILDYLTETRGSTARTTGKVLCNKLSYLLFRVTGQSPQLGWHRSPRHWYRFPFSLRGEVLWSRQLGAWFRPENEASIEFMLHEDNYEPVDWVAPTSGEILLDIGAFVGWHTIRAARIVGSAGRVICLEPDPGNRQQLENNLALNQITNCTVIPLGAWSQTGRKLGWYTEKSPDCCRIDEDESPRTVQTTTIDDLVSQMRLERLDWIKMDVEGAEVEALRGAERTLREYRPRLFIEIHDTVRPVKELLKLYEYSIEREAYDHSPEPHGWYQARACDGTTSW